MQGKDVTESPQLILNKPHVASFRRLLHLDPLEAGESYDELENTSLKAILSLFFGSLRFDLSDGTQLSFRVQHLEVERGLCGFYSIDSPGSKAFVGIGVNVTVIGAIGDTHGIIKEVASETFRLCNIPELTPNSYFEFIAADGSTIRKCPVGQIQRAPGIRTIVQSDHIGISIKPQYGKQLEIYYSLKDAAFSVIIGKAEISEDQFFYWLDNATCSSDTEKLFANLSAPSNPFMYDLSLLGRRNINRVLGGCSESRLLEREDVIRAFGVLSDLYASASGKAFANNLNLKEQALNIIRTLKELNPPYRPPKPYLFDQYHLANKRVNLIGDFLDKKLRRHFAHVYRELAQSPPLSSKKTHLISPLLKLDRLQKSIDQLFLKNNMVQMLNECNPLSALAHRRKLTFLNMKETGNEENAGRDTRVAVGLRDIHYSMQSRICPVDTPQGPITGLNLSMAVSADVNELGLLTAPLRERSTGILQYHDASFDEDRLIAPSETSPHCRRDAEELVRTPGYEAEWLDVSPSQIFSVTAALIPFIGHDDGNRAMMATSMMKQALPLKDPDLPLIKTGFEQVVAKESGWCIYAADDGSVTRVTDDHISIGGERYPLHRYRPTPQKTLLHHTSCVKPGDQVRKGQMLASGAGTKNGELAIGKNLLAAFMFYEGYNFEDAIVISETASRKLTSLRITELECIVRQDECVGPIHDNSDDSHLNIDGIVKQDTYISPGMVLVAKTKQMANEKKTTSEAKLAKLIERLCGVDPTHMDTSYRTPANVTGRVVGIQRSQPVVSCLLSSAPSLVRERIVIRVLEERPVRMGDKLANRHGNKGIISKIVPDEDMPVMPDGTVVDIILNPLGVFNRMNVGQLLEMHLGWAATETAPSIVVKQFEENQELVNLMRAGFMKHGLDQNGSVILQHGRRGSPYSRPVVVGYLYMMKLNHMSADKINVRSIGRYSSSLLQPFQGKIPSSRGDMLAGGQRVGEMEVWALAAYNARELLRESLALKSDDTVGRVLLQRELGQGNRRPAENYLPYGFKHAISLLRGLCFDVSVSNPLGESLDITNAIRADSISRVGISLMTQEQIVKMSNGLLGRSDSGMRLVRTEDLSNPNVFGSRDTSRCACGLSGRMVFEKWCNRCDTAVYQRPDLSNFRFGHIELPAMVPHPLFYNDIVSLLPHIAALHRKGSVPQDASLDDFVLWCSKKGLAAHEVISSFLSDARGVEELEISLNGDKRQEHMLKALELIKCGRSGFIRYLPVIPLRCREEREEMSGQGHPINRSYTRLVKACNRFAQMLNAVPPKAILNNEYNRLYKEVHAHFEAVLDLLKGRDGLIRRHLLGKRCDFSGRIVVIPDPHGLSMDECGLPADFLAKLFSVEFSRLLRNKGKIDTTLDFNRYVEKHADSDELITLLREVIGDRVVLLNRFPSLHRVSIQAFHPVPIRERDVLKIHPVVCAGFNADFDGDQFSIHLPISYQAQKEAKERCLPSKNILSPASGKLSPVSLNKDIIAGIYWMTMDNDNESAATFENLEKAYEYSSTSRLHQSLEVSLGGKVVKTTSGRVLFNKVLGRDGANDFINKPIDQGELNRLLMEIVLRRGCDELPGIIQRLAHIGFHEATMSGISISYFDFPEVATDSKLTADIKELRKRSEESVREQMSREKKNSASIIFHSGAGKKNSIYQIAAVRGVMARPDGSEVPFPVLSNFRKGLSAVEYFVSGHGARKGSVDKAISVTKSGHLMRRIVEAVHHVRILPQNCSCADSEGILKRALVLTKYDESGRAVDTKTLIPLEERIYLRYAATDIKTAGGMTIVEKGGLIDREAAAAIVGNQITSVRIMSPVTCTHGEQGICFKCYGNEFHTKKPADAGHAAGIIAAQSVSEPCTQLSMRVFHRGGQAGGDITGGFGILMSILSARHPVFDEWMKSISEPGSEQDVLWYPENEVPEEYTSCIIPRLIDEIQVIFVSEGVTVDDRHIEIILRYVLGDHDAKGITAVLRGREGFLAKISFENLKARLADAAATGAEDYLTGLKEWVLLTKFAQEKIL